MSDRPSTLHAHQTEIIDGQKRVERSCWRIPSCYAKDLIYFLHDLGLKPHQVEHSFQVFPFEKKT